MVESQRYNQARYKHWVNDHVRFCDLDALGHVNNNAMGTYFENARASLFSIITPEWPWRDTIFVLARTTVDFTHELHMPARLKVGNCIIKIGRTSMVVANALFHGETPIAYSEAVSVLIDQKTRKTVEISQELRQAMMPYFEGTTL